MKFLGAAVLLSAAAFPQGMPIEGNPDSRVRVIAYEDLQCSDCAAYRLMLDQSLLPKYQDRVAFEHRDFPLPKHAWARRAAIAARAFDQIRPEVGIAFRVFCLSTLKQITTENLDERIKEFARVRSIRPEQILERMNDPRLEQAVEQDYQEGLARGIARTPTVLVNGTAFIEKFSLEAISRSIDKALQENSKF